MIKDIDGNEIDDSIFDILDDIAEADNPENDIDNNKNDHKVDDINIKISKDLKISEETIREAKDIIGQEPVVLNQLYVNEGKGGTYMMYQQQSKKFMKMMGWDLSGKDVKTNTYIQGVNLFLKYLANESKYSKIGNYKNRDVINFVTDLVKRNYGEQTIKSYMSGIQLFHKGLLNIPREKGGTKNRIQSNEDIYKITGTPKRKNGKLDRAWRNDEFDAIKRRADALGRADIVLGLELGDQFGIRIQTLGRLTVKQLRQAMKKGELKVKEKGGRVRAIPIETDNQRSVINNLLVIAAADKLTAENHIFRDSPTLTANRKIRGDNSHDKTVKSMQNFISKYRKEVQHEDRKSIEDYKGSKKLDIIEKTELSFHGLRYRYAQRQMDKFLGLGMSYKEACWRTSKLLGHNRVFITKIYLAQKVANEEVEQAVA